ncbi:DUF72 domain-containing protein [Telluribacter humicola]|uniref:DUF72 domain-containing protein n=1 Tax=Telluribacter humicola TaxID=1720261 RepID=UPI001A97571D|nr:DUF72 domain-containing protein [Telluribacter humicola]
MHENLYIGTSGWSYTWKGIFYPEELKSADYLPYFAGYFNTTEVNSSHYHYTMAKTIQKWLAQTPAHFNFAAKLHKEITHEKRLVDVADQLEKWMSRFLIMGDRLGPVLIQLPASFHFKVEVAESFFSLLRDKYPTQPFALEVRHKSWLVEESIEMLRYYHIAFVIADSPRWPKLETVTADQVYLRLHGEEKMYSGPYSDEALERFSYMINDWLMDEKEVWVFFNNTIGGTATKDAEKLQKMLENM